MSAPVILPPVPELDRRIALCRQELAELKRLKRAALSLARAQQAREERQAASPKGGPARGR